MTTTAHFQVRPDWFPDAKSCLESEKKSINSNPRYKFFCQTHFTAGDFQQFKEYRDMTNGDFKSTLNLRDNIFSGLEHPSLAWDGYTGLNAMCVENTFNYLFEKFKKGIFLKTKGGKLSVFLPFSKKNFANEWHDRIEIDPKYMDLFSFIKQAQILSGYRYNPKNVNKFIDTWYSNNSLVRHEFPIYEGDTNVSNFSDMFHTLCKERKVPDVEFFLNRRDFPLLKTDGTEPYDDMFDSDSFPLLSHKYDKYTPILSMVGKKGFADIPIPTGDDWAMVCREEGKFFSKTCQRDFKMKGDLTPTGWKKRKPVAVFRGSSTGKGITVETNPRLKLAQLSHERPLDTDGKPLLDAGITEWNARPRKLKGQKYLQIIDPKIFPFGLVPRLTPQEQTEYKYIVNVDGHVASYRLSLELSSGTCILLADSEYKLWYRHLLQPFVHYVPVKSDLSDLLQKIQWCKKNDGKCLEIAKNAKKFAEKYLTKNGILDYLEKLLWDIKKTVGNYIYNVVPVAEIQKQEEISILQRIDRRIEGGDVFDPPFLERCYDLYEGIKVALPFELKTLSTLFKNKNTEITRHTFSGINLVKKRSKDIVHEAFVSIVGTNQLLKQIPNFVYAFGVDIPRESLYLEHIEGQTFSEYIKSPEFTMENYLLILLQLALALNTAQRVCNLVHNDLTPWNIVIQKCEEKTVEYIVNEYTVYKVKTTLIPVIIDMGRSHIIYKNVHYGSVNPYTFSAIHDIATILITSLYEVSCFDLSREQVEIMISLSNFLYVCGYRERKFVRSGKNGLGDIRFFLNRAKNFSEIVSRDTKSNLSPLDFVVHVLGMGDFPVSIENEIGMRKCWDPEVICKYMYWKEEKKRREIFADSLKSLGKGVYDREIFQSILPYLKKYKIPYAKKREEIEKNVAHSDGLKLHSGAQVLPELSFDENTFLLPEKVLELLERVRNVKIPSFSQEEVEDFYYVSLRGEEKKKISTPSPRYIANLASVNTLRELSKKVYKNDLELARKNRLTDLVDVYSRML